MIRNASEIGVNQRFPNNPHALGILKSLIDQVGLEMNLAHGERDKWFNDGISFIGLETKSDVTIFSHGGLILKAAEWHEMLAHKLTAFRGERDVIDAIQFLKEIKDVDKNRVFVNVSKYRPFVPSIADSLFSERFEMIWRKVHAI